ncbi:class I SAM-dependent methyltransferase [Nonomuraea sp. M3C6]|uniref:S-adenosyl-L-methionine-dependent methyltransferase n=1 Tax=Nonomuraea marmarensis TaxID=3351344 RepID=A0ABW7AKZ6_9ACTN
MVKRRPAAQTALGPMVIAAVEQFLPHGQRLVDDDLAVRFLPPSARLMVRACRWRPLRQLMISASETRAAGIWGSILCRKRYADDRVSEALAAGIGQVVVLGAGLDTRACRLVAPAGGRAYELDLPENITDKQQRLKEVFDGVPEGMTLIPVDFEHDDLAQALATRGFEADRPAMFVWEAVTQYLTEDAVRRTLTFLAKAAPGSRLIFTYVRQDFLDGTNFYGAPSAHRDFVVKDRIWHFGLAPEAVGGLLAEYGWAERGQVGPDEYRTRYLQGRDISPSEIERFVYAERP